eukprot:3951423-Amphidinium_carterae.1
MPNGPQEWKNCIFPRITVPKEECKLLNLFSHGSADAPLSNLPLDADWLKNNLEAYKADELPLALVL